MTALGALVVAAPLVTKVLPVPQSNISAVRLAEQIRDAADLGWSGEVRALGSLQVPLTGSTFGGIARVLGERTDLRVWWRSGEDWRIDRLRSTGESDLVRDGGLTVRWKYEENRVNFTPYSPVRLPDDVDVVPASLAARLLAGARPSELSRLASVRVAGRIGVGLRLVPNDERSTISRVDVWADQESGLPLRVEAYADPAGKVATLATELTSLQLGEPSAKKTAFRLADSLDFSRGVALDEAAGANAFAPFVPPASIAGLPRRGQPSDFGAVGVYGRGPTAVLAIPLRSHTAAALGKQLARSSKSRESGSGISLEVGPISVLLVDGYRAHFLLSGTVRPQTLQQAASDLIRNVRRTE